MHRSDSGDVTQLRLGSVAADIATDPPDPPRLRVSEVGEFIRFNSCERRFKLSFNGREQARRLPFFERLFSPLDPVLQQSGNDAEDAWQQQLRDAGYRELAPAETVADPDGSVRPERTPWSRFAQVASTLQPGELAYGRELIVEGHIGAFDVEGAIDFALIAWTDGGQPTLRLIEGKSSRKDRTYHRIQVVSYLILVRQELARVPLEIAGRRVAPDEIDVAVARIDEDTGTPQRFGDLEPLADTAREEADIERLLSDRGRLAQIVSADLDEVPFQLNGKCDGCVFNVDCLSESGRQRRLELLGIDPSTSAALRDEGIADIDDLAELDVEGDTATRLRTRPGFTESLVRLRERARARRSTLPAGAQDPDRFEVRDLPGSIQGQLPSHTQHGRPLVRVYLAVDFDYTENRVGALTAHVTRSTHELDLRWTGPDGARRPDSAVHERRRTMIRDAGGRFVRFDVDDERPLDTTVSATVIEEMSSEWTGHAELDTGAEKQLLHRFFVELVDTIRDVCTGDDHASVHFYVWSRNEISRLVEACARADSRLLGHLRELLGARESLEQLIFSSVEEEIDSRFGLGWTGRGLVVVASLGWYGQRFHWTRMVRDTEVRLDEVFTQDLFDFRTSLGLNADGSWAADPEAAASRHRFEIRARHFDTLPAPYWRAMWGTLPTAHELNSPRVAGALARYDRADRRTVRAYLAARVEALRWLEERVQFKNDEIDKPPLALDDLPQFELGVGDVRRAAVDVLRLDAHVKASGWIAERLGSVRDRVAAGVTLPVRDVEQTGDRTLAATVDVTGFDADEHVMQANWAPDAFVRLTVRSADPDRGQTYRQLTRAGLTARITAIDWTTGRVELDAIPGRETHYVFSNASVDYAAARFDVATIDESPSDYVAGRVENRLNDAAGTPATSWLDPTGPQVPAAPTVAADALADLRTILDAFRDDNDHSLDGDQIDAIVDGTGARVQLLQGPPGTGKTATTAVATLARILLRRRPGDVLLVAATTHTAVDNLLERITRVRPHLIEAADAQGRALPPVHVARIVDDLADPYGGADGAVLSRSSVGAVRGLAADNVVVLGGTTNGVLKIAHTLRNRFPTFPELVVDEASMMQFPHFLALATLAANDGFVLLAGDHRQLAPILAHDWDNEDRPPVEVYQPHLSAYESISALAALPQITDTQIRRSALTLSFRLPPSVVDLISRVYHQDDIDLHGLTRPARPPAPATADLWEAAWTDPSGLLLATHDERGSRKANAVEVEIIRRLCAAATAPAPEQIAVITPHRAQRELLRAALGHRVDVVDTVERLQGGERDSIIVSGTASDPAAIAAAASFILDLNRSNVAFSRVKDRLIVVCAETLLDHIPVELDLYDAAMLWKALRATCTRPAGDDRVDGHQVALLAG